jgi:hypothetical protein
MCSRFAAALVVVGVVVLFESLNFTGFCYSEGCFFSDEQFIDSAILYNINARSLTPGPQKRYDSIEEFKRLNPDCCEVRRSGDPFLDPIWWNRIFGFYTVMVDLWYRTNEAGGPDAFYNSLISFDACGRRGEAFGITENHDRIIPAATR